MTEPLDLEPIKARIMARMGEPGYEDVGYNGIQAWDDLAALVAEVERLRELVALMAPHAVEGAAEFGHRDLVDRFAPYAGPEYAD